MEHDPRSVNAEDASKAFTEILGHVEADGTPVEIVREGKVVARLVPAEQGPKTIKDLRLAWANRTRLDPEDAAQWERELEELRASTPLPPSPWD